MSGAAEKFRGWSLATRAHIAAMHANRLGTELQAVIGAGGTPDQDAVAQFEQAYEQAERLYLEYTMTLPSAERTGRS